MAVKIRLRRMGAKNGAQPTDTVKALLKKSNII